MKLRKIMAILLALLLAADALPALAAVGTGWDDECRMHVLGKLNMGVIYGKHAWALKSAVPGNTCTSEGEGTYQCSYCGVRIKHPTKAQGHKWGSWETVEEATCTKQGEEYRVCRVCGEKETRKTDKAPHTWGPWKENADSAGPGADLTGPDSGEWKTAETDPCTRQVTETRVCRVCGETRTRTTGKAAHTWGPWTVTLETTDFSAGIRQHTCRVCGTEESEEFDPDPTYRQGDSGEGVKALQEGLNALGYDCGKADGSFGKKTVTAVKAIEKDHGMPADGVAWPGVQKWLLIPRSPHSNGDSAHEMMSLFRGNPISTFSGGLPFKITQQPEGGTYEPGEGMLLSVGASGGEKPYSYEWHRCTVGNSFLIDILPSWLEKYLKNDRIISTDGPEITVGGTTGGDWMYYCIVRDSGDGKERSEAVVAGPRLRFTLQPENASLYGKESVTLKASADVRDRKVSYVWYRDDAKIGNAGEKTITVNTAGKYYCEASDGSDTVRSETAVVYDEPEPWVRSAAAPAYLRPGETTAEISVTFQAGVPPVTCEWYLDGELQTSYTSYSVVETKAEWTALDLGTYVFLLTDSAGNTASGTAEVEYDQLTILEQPQDGKVSKDGGTYTLSVKVGEEAAEPVTYTLYRDQEPAGTQVNDPSFTVDRAGTYSIHISDRWGRWADSREAVVKEYDPTFRIIGQTKGAVIRNHSTKQNGERGVNLVVGATGGKRPYQFSWYRDGKLVMKSDKNKYFATKPGRYICRVTDAEGRKVWSKEIPVIYRADKPVITTQPKDALIGKTGYATLTCTAKSGTGNDNVLSYNWQRKAGAGWISVTASGKTQKLKPKKPGIYRCVVKDRKTGQTAVSRAAAVTEKLKIAKIGLTYVSPQNVRLTVLFTGGTGPYMIRVYRKEKYQVYDKGQWITRSRLWQVKHVVKQNEGGVSFTVPRKYKTVIQGYQVTMKAEYVIRVFDAGQGLAQKTVSVK